MRQASWPESTLLSELMDWVATMGMDARLAGEGEGLFVSGGVVLSHGGEALEFVTEEHGRPEVAVWVEARSAPGGSAGSGARRS